MDGVNEAWVADRPTSHRCWSSRSALQGWLCLDNTSRYRCWRWKPIELSEEETFTALIHCGALELDRCAKIDVHGHDEHALKLQWSVFWRQCFQGFTAPTEAGIPTFQIVVDGYEMEMWLGWLEPEIGMDSNRRSCWHRFHGGGRCAERAWHWSFSWSAVLCCRSTPAHGDHISTYL